MRNFVKTGIPGLDVLIENKGFPKGANILLLGAPGSGKSIFGMQYIYRGAVEYNEKGVYVIFHENPERVFEYMLSFGWDIEVIGRKEMVYIVDAASPIIEAEQLMDMSELKEILSPKRVFPLIREIVEKTKAERLVIDSLVSMHFGEDEEERKFNMLNFAIKLNSLGCTSIIIGEAEHRDYGEKIFPFETFIFDGIINLYLDTESRERRMNIRKMRGMRHALGSYRMKIGDSGIEILP